MPEFPLRRYGTRGAQLTEAAINDDFLNRKHDLDYAVSLAFADGIASNETAGDMARFVRWMYGNAKLFLAVNDVRR